jgi:hypothetical protein
MKLIERKVFNSAEVNLFLEADTFYNLLTVVYIKSVLLRTLLPLLKP